MARRTDANDVQDVVADTFLVAWRRFDDLPEDPLPWLFSTARKVMANRHRSQSRRRALDGKLAAGPSWTFEEPAPTERAEVDERLRAAIARLPDAEREAFILVAWDGLDAARAARAAGCSAATFRMRLHRARRRLRRQLHPFRRPASLTDIATTAEDPQ